MSVRYVAEELAARIVADRKLLMEVCSALECLADHLKAPESVALAERLNGVIVPYWRAHVKFQEDIMFPLLRRHYPESATALQNMAQFTEEHASFGDASCELREYLSTLAAGDPGNVEMVGYMLRDAFRQLATHIENEARFLQSTIPSVLAPEDRRAVESWFAQHPFPAESGASSITNEHPPFDDHQ